MVKHDARARYCIEVGVPREHLRDDIRCEACDELHTLMHLDPTVTEILTREPWCTACQAGDKRPLRLDPYPFHCGDGPSCRHSRKLAPTTRFDPRPGYSQNEEDYQ